MSIPGRIAVIGAGLAGLVCAQRLRDAGATVVVLDKGRRPGGRMATRVVDGDAFDHGAQYFTARDAHFREAVDRWMVAGVVAPWEATLVTLEGGRISPAPAAERFVGVPAMNAVAAHLAGDLPLRPSTRVEALARRSGRWAIRLAGGIELPTVDVVVLALPPPQAALLLPEASDLTAALGTVTLAPCQAVMAAYDRALPVDFDAAFVRDDVLAWAARNGSKPGRPAAECWVLHATPGWSAVHVEDDPHRVARALLARFATCVGGSLPAPRRALVHRWRYALPTQAWTDPCLFDPATGLGACGDWCGGAKIESAFTSGHALADRLLADATV